jgi:hypothetical protein
MTLGRGCLRIGLSLFAVVFLITSARSLAAQPRWGEITPKACLPNGTREWSAILWDIPGGESWEAACDATAASVGGQLRYPNRCVTNTNVWGVWEVADSQCPVTQPDPLLYADLNLSNRTQPRRSLRVEYILEHEERIPPDGLVQFVEKNHQVLTAAAPLALYRWTPRPRLQAGVWRVRIRVWIARPDGTERFEEATVQEFPFDSGGGAGLALYFSIADATDRASGYRITRGR